MSWNDKMLFVLGFTAATLFFLWAGMLQKPHDPVVHPASADQDFGLNLSVNAHINPDADGIDSNTSYSIDLISSDGFIDCMIKYQGNIQTEKSGTCAHTYYYPTAGQTLTAHLIADGLQVTAGGWDCLAKQGKDGTTFDIGTPVSPTAINLAFATNQYALLPASEKQNSIECVFTFAEGFDFELDSILDGDQVFTVERGDSLSIPFSLDIVSGERPDNNDLTNFTKGNRVYFDLLEEPPFANNFDQDFCSQDCINALNIQTTSTTPLGTYRLTIVGAWPGVPPRFTPLISKYLPVTVRVIEKARSTISPMTGGPVVNDSITGR